LFLNNMDFENEKIMIATLLSAAVSTPAFADNSNELADAGLIFEMDSSQSVELALLSSKEMKSTEGTLIPVLFILGSAAVSAWSYHGVNYYNTGSIGSSSGAAWAAGAGGLAAAAPMTRVLGPYPNTGGFGVALARPFTSNPYKSANQFGRIDFHRNSHDSFIHTHSGRWGR
jgi:hypothetical protein